MDDLRGKTALITGSTSGIGEAAALAFARCGGKVTVTGRSEERGRQVVEAIRRAKGEAVFVQADLADPDTPKRLVEATADAWGRLDVVINNAALVCNKPVDDVTHEDWDRLFRVNVKAPFFVVQSALPHLRASRGVVINVSSINRWKNSRNNLVYDSMKASLNHMTRGLALDLRAEGIRVNVVMPGGTKTRLLQEWFEQVAPSESDTRYAEATAAESVADPAIVADAIVLLCSRRAAWIHGAEIPLDGGYHLG